VAQDSADAFVSYTQADRAWAEWIAWPVLAAAGWRQPELAMLTDLAEPGASSGRIGHCRGRFSTPGRFVSGDTNLAQLATVVSAERRLRRRRGRGTDRLFCSGWKREPESVPQTGFCRVGSAGDVPGPRG